MFFFNENKISFIFFLQNDFRKLIRKLSNRFCSKTTKTTTLLLTDNRQKSNNKKNKHKSPSSPLLINNGYSNNNNYKSKINVDHNCNDNEQVDVADNNVEISIRSIQILDEKQLLESEGEIIYNIATVPLNLIETVTICYYYYCPSLPIIIILSLKIIKMISSRL